MTDPAILDAIPHRPPFLLVDEIVARHDQRIVCRKRFRGDEFWFAGHYPDYPLTPGVILCEAALQAGAILLAQQTKAAEGVPVATRMDDVRFKKMVRPGDIIDIDVEITDRVSTAYYLTGKVTLEGQVALRLTFACTIAPREP
ncbi:MAG: beta-hydroxyacyl-ACP dehydratase [Planctomycetales bacterium]|nr:beta-hydroxyacyl-ACP dehydratase [Planctomycetales bacterium]